MAPMLAVGESIRPFASKHVRISRDGRITVFGWSTGITDGRLEIRSPENNEVASQMARYGATLERVLFVSAQEASGRPVTIQLSPMAAIQLWPGSTLLHLRKLRHHTVDTIRTARGKSPAVRMQPVRDSITVDWKDSANDFGVDSQRLRLASIDISPAFCGISCVISG